MPAAHDLSAHAHHRADEAHNRHGERRTRWVAALTAAMMIGELTFGYLTDSVALRADGWHMGTHVGALGFTVIAYWYARTRAGADAFSFGTGKVYALAGYTSGVLLALVAIWIAVEGIHHLVVHERPTDYHEAIAVAGVGLVVNLVSALLLGSGHRYGHAHDHDDHDHDDHDHDHDHAHPPAPGTLDFNMRAAYVHILADAMTSLLALGALTLGSAYSGLWFLDSLMGPIGCVIILAWSFSLCRQAARQLLDVVSSPAHEAMLRERLQAIDDVRVTDLHIWELGPGRRSCIVSLVSAAPRELDYYRAIVLGALDVAHLTIEIHRCELPHDEPQLRVAHGREH